MAFVGLKITFVCDTHKGTFSIYFTLEITFDVTAPFFKEATAF